MTLTKAHAQKWIAENTHHYENLEKGIIYVIFENNEMYVDIRSDMPEKPLPKIDLARIKYRQVRNKAGIVEQFRFSENNNKFITKIAICQCGKYLASSRLRATKCDECKYDHKIKHNKKRQKNNYVSKGIIKNGVSISTEPKPDILKIAQNATGGYKKIKSKPYELEPSFDDLYFDCEIMPESERKWRGV